MNTQEAFNTIAVHLLTQSKRCMDSLGEDCMYYGVDGAKCAIGVLIPEDMYNEHMELQTVSQIMKNFPSVGKLLENIDINLLIDCQVCHDSYVTDEWNKRLNDLAEIYKLEMPEIQ